MLLSGELVDFNLIFWVLKLLLCFLFNTVERVQRRALIYLLFQRFSLWIFEILVTHCRHNFLSILYETRSKFYLWNLAFVSLNGVRLI